LAPAADHLKQQPAFLAPLQTAFSVFDTVEALQTKGEYTLPRCCNYLAPPEDSPPGRLGDSWCLMPSSRHLVMAHEAGDGIVDNKGDVAPLGRQYGDSPSQFEYYNMLYKWREISRRECPNVGNLTDDEVRGLERDCVPAEV
jgi:hypothetical protein